MQIEPFHLLSIPAYLMYYADIGKTVVRNLSVLWELFAFCMVSFTKIF